MDRENTGNEVLLSTSSSSHRKPLLTIEQQIANLKARGVTFNLCSEKEAAAYLADGNNYLRTASYRKLFPRQTEGEHVGHYVNLDFSCLMELSSIDRLLREAFLMVAIDVEHFAKLKVLKCAEAQNEDGYAIVADFFSSLNHADRNRLRGSLNSRAREGEARDTYSGDLIARYKDDLPLWVFMEVLEFGSFLTFYKFCAERWSDNDMLQEHYVLKSVKSLRNATAHNSCIVNGFKSDAQIATYKTPQLIVQSLNVSGLKNSRTRKAKLKNLRIAQIAATLYAVNALCQRDSTRKRHAERIAVVRARYESSSSLLRKGTNVLYRSSISFGNSLTFGCPVGQNDFRRKSLRVL